MEVFNLILIIVFFATSAVMIGKSADEDFGTPFTLIFFTIAAFSCLVSLIYMATEPKDSDVLNGRAEYVETIHISKGDTIKTYHIEPKESK